jgi:parvulin-like peptidyl-prolyl isomerase
MSLTTMRKKFKKAEKPIQWTLVVIFVLGCFSLYGSYNMTTPGARADDLTVARINDEVLPREVYDRALQINQDRLKMSNPGGTVTPEQEIQVRAAAFEMALNDTLRVQTAEKQGVRVSDRDVRAEQKKLVDQVLANQLKGASAEEKRQFEAQARQVWFPMPLVRNQVMSQALEKKIRDETKPTEADLMKSFQEYKARHILIKSDTRSDEEAKRKAQEVLDKAKANVGFEDLARKYSEDPGSKDKGGDLGWVSQKTGFVPEFKAALLKLGKGQVSPLVKTSFGYHVIKVDDTRSTLPKDINKPGKKQQYLKEYTDQVVQEKFQAMMGEARQSAKIEAVDPFVQGYLAESDMLEARQKGNQPLANKKLTEAVQGYEKAAVGRYGGSAIYAKLAELYQQSNQDEKAIAALQRAVGSYANAQLAWQLGELQLKNKKNAEAIASYQKAADAAYDMPWLRPQLAERFKTLKRPDLAAKQQAEWTKWQKNASKGGAGSTMKLPTGETVELQHEQKKVSPEEAKKLLKDGATTTVQTETPDKK